jgi:hypothetical protein
MSKNNRHQSVVSRHADAQKDEDNWFGKLENSLIKDAVQPKKQDDYLFHQINTIMNGTKSKYSTVEEAVEEMKARSGYSNHVTKIKVSENEGSNKKVAADTNEAKPKKPSIPTVIQKCPQIKDTLENFIRDTKGNVSIPAIIEKVKNIHNKDVSNDKDWDEDSFIRLVSQLNLKAKQQNPANYETHTNLGAQDQLGDNDIDASNTDAFHALMPFSNT